MSEQRRRYREYLRSAHWKALRQRAISSVGSKCEWCSSTEKLHVHHERYRKLYDCTLGDLVVMCQSCHDDWHHPQRVSRRKKAAKQQGRQQGRSKPAPKTKCRNELDYEMKSGFYAMLDEMRRGG